MIWGHKTQAKLWSQIGKKVLGSSLLAIFILSLCLGSLKRLSEEGIDTRVIADNSKSRTSRATFEPQTLQCGHSRVDRLEALVSAALVVRLEEVIRERPSDVELRLERAFFYHQLGRPLLALADLDCVLELCPENRDARRQLSRIVTDCGMSIPRQLRFRFTDMTVAGSEDVGALKVLGAIHLELGNDIRAVKTYSQVLEAGSDPEAYWGRSLALDRLGFSLAARKDLEQVIY